MSERADEAVGNYVELPRIPGFCVTCDYLRSGCCLKWKQWLEDMNLNAETFFCAAWQQRKP